MKKELFKRAFLDTIPVFSGYLVLGFGFGILLYNIGYNWFYSFLMSGFIYAGSMQYVLIDLIKNHASFLTVIITTIMVNGRHLFYGISMLPVYQRLKKNKAYLIFSLTDETYSLVQNVNDKIENKDKEVYYRLVSVLDHSYWIFGSLLGSVFGQMITFDLTGIDFSLTALFLVIFTEQWLSTENHLIMIASLVISALSLVLFGKDNFLLLSMIGIVMMILGLRKKEKHE